jgi:hypothetical protein
LYPDGISVGDGGTSEKRHMFDKCPGYYLRGAEDGPTIDGLRNAFDLSWEAHFLLDKGIVKLDKYDNLPPKLREAILLIESENRARDALEMQQKRETMTRNQNPNAKRVIKG